MEDCSGLLNSRILSVVVQDQTLKLWDVRMLPSGTDTMGLPGVPRCLHTFEGHRDVIGGVLVQGLDAVSFAGQHLGVFSLQVGSCRRMVVKPCKCIALLTFSLHTVCA